ncbi:peptidoglycan-binding domain-containing protein [Cochleicola gelatinilyticus]|uniref:Peptidoglycan binding-like domain-containing protein n=1 Tax=Cochleicola gelatinilyticus TaxID=1763537 RepID=A0A167KG80_9FLAO|nr:peptidoglycan-binding domain-containing protein [Cochleicola gelatinilyticus]OAB81860.1 hypothetical protein ULVI_00565 [Cochleicola gelatinilyticus]
MSALFLGSCDADKYPADRKKYLAPFHRDGLLVGKVSFRDDDRTAWRSFRKESASEVTELQKFLHQAGFMPRGVVDGVFDYVTQAAVRLFQEYVRTVDPNGDSSMLPDGIVGRGTNAHISRWKQNGTVSDWGKASVETASEEYTNWIHLLQKAKAHYSENPGSIMKQVNKIINTHATRKATDWDFGSDKIHLIGIRRKQSTTQHDRINDDLFVLLIQGMVFKFWGSTDPSVRMAQRADEAFLVEGQHKYRFGWHKIWKESKVYRALKPYDPVGVLVLRDRKNDNALTDADVDTRKGNPVEINNSINIHWSGIGGLNHSAGCQVIAGKSYINNHNVAIDCTKFASSGYSELNSSNKKTKGAYNVLADLIVCYSKPEVDYVYYTLGREESLDLDTNVGSGYAAEALQKMNPSSV